MAKPGAGEMSGGGYATAESTRQRVGEIEFDWANRTFCPHFPGLHVCGADHDENRFFTVLNVPARDDDHARAIWLACRAECEVEEAAGDLCIDLNTSDGHEDDFWSNRQLLPRLAAIAKATAS